MGLWWVCGGFAIGLWWFFVGLQWFFDGFAVHFLWSISTRFFDTRRFFVGL